MEGKAGGGRRSCVKRVRRGGTPRRVAFAATVSEVVGRADADVDRTPRGEPSRCSCCGLHIVGYSFACCACAASSGRADEYALCAMCFAAHAKLSATPELGRAHGIEFVVHEHAPRSFARGGDDDQGMLDEILRDRRELMVNGGGEALDVEMRCSTERDSSAGSEESEAEILNVCAAAS